MSGNENEMAKLPSGIAGLDRAVGGFPRGRTIVVIGDTGSGKTVLGLQFARNCCAAGHRTVYLSTEEGADDLRTQADSFGWDMRGLEGNGTMAFLEFGDRRAQETEASVGMGMDERKGRMLELVEHLPRDTKVLVLDSLGTHTSNLSPPEFMDQFDLLVTRLRSRGITALIVIDSATSRRYNEAALYHAYGAISMQRRENPFTGQRERVMDIVKIRNTRTPIQLLPYEITRHGLELTVAVAPAAAAGPQAVA
jgi:KaiC/GvpD/RAD55 family RecA-like ATPase